jgi:hypothetical protein
MAESTKPVLQKLLFKPGAHALVLNAPGKYLDRDVVRLAADEVGLEVVSQVAVDDIWSALRARVV